MEQERKIYAYSVEENWEGLTSVHPTLEKAIESLKRYGSGTAYKDYSVNALYTDGSRMKVSLDDFIGIRERQLTQEEKNVISWRVADGVDFQNKFVQNCLQETANGDSVRITGFPFSRFGIISETEKQDRIVEALVPQKEYYWK